MPHARPLNDEEVLKALDIQTRVYGSGERLAREIGIVSSQLREIKCGRRAISSRIANGLGFQLMWVRVKK